MVTLLTAIIGLEEPFRAFRMALAGCQLPPARASDALIPPWPGARFTRQVTLGALTSVAVITEKPKRHAQQNTCMRTKIDIVSSRRRRGKTRFSLPLRAGRPALPALQLQAVLAGGAVQAGDAALAGVQARDAKWSRGLYHRVVTVVTLGDAALALEERRVRAGYALVLRGAGACLAGRVARLALAVLVVLVGVAVAAILRRAQALFVQAPALDAAGAAQRGAGRTAGRTRHAFPTLLVGAIAGRARRVTRACDTFESTVCIDTLHAG